MCLCARVWLSDSCDDSMLQAGETPLVAARSAGAEAVLLLLSGDASTIS